MSIVYGADPPPMQVPYPSPPTTQLSHQGCYSVTPSIGANVNPTFPPASRRASSTGDIGPDGSRGRLGVSANRGMGRWEPGMPLPPPPPGPPPSRPSMSRNSSYGPPSRDQPTAFVTECFRSSSGIGNALGMIPPTPDGWVDDSLPPTQSICHTRSTDQSHNYTMEPLNDSTIGQSDNLGFNSPHLEQIGASQTTGDTNTKGIRERRIESRNGRSPSGEINSATDPNICGEASNRFWPADLVLGNPAAPGLTRRRAMTKSTPRSGRSPLDEQNQITSSSSSSGPPVSSSPSHSTPRQNSARTPDRINKSIQTPPFSPGYEPGSSSLPKEKPPHIPPKALPTPPLNSAQESGSISGLIPPSSADKDRPISHLLHIPVDGSTRDTPLSPEKPAKQQTTAIPNNTMDAFKSSAIKRHVEFIEREATAPNAAEALRLFAEYILSECSIRELRYGMNNENGSFDAQTIRDKLFEPVDCRKVEKTVEESPRFVGNPSITQNRGLSPDLRPPRIESGWWNNYKPCLSPIASMSMSNDEMSSRGRAPSRWWESQTGSDSGGCGSQGVKRSKQEAKYMGVPRQTEIAPQAQRQGTGEITHDSQFAYCGEENGITYGQSEYPPEKVGWHDSEPPPGQGLSRNPSFGRETQKLDISRFVTLPPPYPRHYPAVNNSHPELKLYRTTVRTLSDLSEVQTIKDDYQDKMKRLEQERQYDLMEQRRGFRVEMNNRIGEGSISYAEAAEAEALRGVEEQKKEMELLQIGFDSYQESVYGPLQGMLSDRINIASNCIDDLQSKLCESAQNESPDQTQEEGDARPELLENLTQLKWLFEVREQLHREFNTLRNERNAKYHALVSLPYKLSKNQEKVNEADGFFKQEAEDRQMAFTTEVLRRSESFMDVIEQKVGRGVELQLSAFWDIAPPLLAILHNIPENLNGFLVRVPQREYEENPSYYRFPLQYLYSLLLHAGKATYQFIESQINLLCLLHEVKSGLMSANCKFMEVQRIISGEPEELVIRDMEESKDEEEKRLTADLKDKVGTVEGQWAEALGSELERVKKRVREWLIHENGWDELEQMMEQS